jgi:hypothetical protein
MLRRVTSNVLDLIAVLVDGTGLIVASLALLRSPAFRLPSLVGWMAVTGAVHMFTGTRLTGTNFLLATLLGGLITAPVVALVDLQSMHGLSTGIFAVGVVVILLLHIVFLVRALIASGSADYPYDD